LPFPTISVVPDRAFDDLVAAMDSAMVVVTVATDEERDGCLVGFHSQASIDPPRYAVWLSTANRTARLAQGAEHLAVHLLEDGQHDLAELFGGASGDDVDKLAHTTWEAGPGGVPLLLACPNRFVGNIVDRHDADGDHVCMVLRPTDSSCRPAGRPLRLGAVTDIEPGHPA
jgi:flavin reductase (DIM6/NTAB) family NADH-FMN oxidoreductase RutF